MVFFYMKNDAGAGHHAFSGVEKGRRPDPLDKKHHPGGPQGKDSFLEPGQGQIFV
jgi:hypothetical protein